MPETKKQETEDLKKLSAIERITKTRAAARTNLKCNAKNEFQSTDYATLNHVHKTILPLLNERFLDFYSQSVVRDFGGTPHRILRCYLYDLVGKCTVEETVQEYLLPDISVEKVTNKVNQFAGGTFTYSVRYLIYLILNVSPAKDKDGNIDTEGARPSKTSYQKRLNDKRKP